MQYKPGQDQKEALDTKNSNRVFNDSAISHSHRITTTKNNNYMETASYMQYECNMVIWGKW